MKTLRYSCCDRVKEIPVILNPYHRFVSVQRRGDDVRRLYSNPFNANNKIERKEILKKFKAAIRAAYDEGFSDPEDAYEEVYPH